MCSPANTFSANTFSANTSPVHTSPVNTFSANTSPANTSPVNTSPAKTSLVLHAPQGLAVGLQQQLQDVWYLFYAITAHKLVIAFCVGLELISGGTKTALTIVYMVIFALVTPIGIAIGIIVTEGSSSPNSISHLWTLTILQGLAGGTILYVTFCEVSCFTICYVMILFLLTKCFIYYIIHF